MTGHYTMTGRWRRGREYFTDLVFHKRPARHAELRLLGCAPSSAKMPHTIEARLPVEFAWDAEEQVQLAVCWPMSCPTDGKNMEEAQDMIQSVIASLLVDYVEEGSLFKALREMGWRVEHEAGAARAFTANVLPPPAAEEKAAPQPRPVPAVNETKGGWNVGGAS